MFGDSFRSQEQVVFMAPFSSINKNHKDTPELTLFSPWRKFPSSQSDVQHQMLCSNNPPANGKVKQIPSLQLSAVKKARGASGWRNATGRKTAFSYTANLIAITHLHVAFSADPLMRVHAFYNVILSKYNKGLMAQLGGETRHAVFLRTIPWCFRG